MLFQEFPEFLNLNSGANFGNSIIKKYPGNSGKRVLEIPENGDLCDIVSMSATPTPWSLFH